MNQEPIGQHIVLRYVYAILLIIVIAVAAVTGSLFLIQKDNRLVRDRVEFFHLESALESEKLARETETLHDLLVASSTSDQTSPLGAAGISRAKIGHRGLLHSMRSRIARLSTLQDQYQAATIASTLQRLIDQFERIDDRIRASETEPGSIASVAALRLTIRQFDRLHAISIENELRKVAEKQKQAPRFFGILSLGLAFSVIAVLYLITSLRSSLARQRKVETDLAEAQERLHQTRKLEALGQLVGGVAHEFNNSLTSILGHTELLLDKSSDNENAENGLEEIRTAGLRAASLTQQLLGFSRQQHPNRSTLDLNDLVRNSEEKLQQMVGSGIELTCDYVDGPYLVELDPAITAIQFRFGLLERITGLNLKTRYNALLNRATTNGSAEVTSLLASPLLLSGSDAAVRAAVTELEEAKTVDATGKETVDSLAVMKVNERSA